ncbi:zeaxanthin epoxidase, chloroplastic [Cynara cardunculus var. scolymus]|uniref:zeaxanthin epoxidase, chloroplastic n=1 Tax=Cynara cardunculus var. scolymus TaxID=59895 RepID=UPI000D62C3A9|nr:zeaxanthin epoxidase, chloroplastic [Cynara cardunculus var. scolymus]
MANCHVFCSSINPTTTLHSKTQFPIEFLHSVHSKIHHPKCKESGSSFKKISLSSKVKAVAMEAPPRETAEQGGGSLGEKKKNVRVLVAGGGIGGLVFALAAKRRGFSVVVFERDLSAIRGEGQYRGPIQIQSNALAALEAIDVEVADEVMKAGCITGQRINGLVDGVSGNWYIKFDTFTPAVERGLPVTRVISRMTLQKILADAVGEDIILNGSNVVNFEDHGDKVSVTLENGEQFEGDLLVGADGIWSKVRKNLFGPKDVTYSGYTCYTGIADFIPADITSVGYRVFLGHKQYFVSSDVGGGKMQWYAFHNEPAGGSDKADGKKERLLEIFGGWCDNVVDLLLATDEDAILRRDIYDRTPKFTWGRGRVTLLGDSVHAMQPNLGQGGCMAIEDSYQLALELDKAWRQGTESGAPIDVVSSLRRYEDARRLRVAVIHGLARMAAIMASTYKAYLGVGLGPLSFLTNFRIPHPGRVGGRFFIDIGMPLMLSWVLGGNGSKLEGRPQQCRLTDKANDELQNWFRDDDALERALSGDWFLLPVGSQNADSAPISLSRDEKIPCIVGSIPHTSIPGNSIVISSPEISKLHARISCKDGAFFVTDLRSENGTYITDNEDRRYRVPPNSPARFHPSDVLEFGPNKKVAFRVKVMRSPPPKIAEEEDGSRILQTA